MIKTKTEKSVMYDFLICLVAVVLMSVYYYGWRALIVTAMSATICYATDLVCVYYRKQTLNFSDISAIISGIIFAQLMPASVPYSILGVSCVVMIVIGKQAFGGFENPVFNTVAVGYAFSSLCWKDAFLSFPMPFPQGQLDLASNVSDKLSHSFTYLIDTVSVPVTSKFDLALGLFAGPMGTTHIFLLMVCAIALMSRRSISFLTFTSCLGTILAAAFFFPTAIRASSFSSLTFELIGGASLFVLIFVACDLHNSPKSKFGRLLYGIIIALLTILFRRYAKVEVGMVFAVIIANVLAEPLDNNSVLFAKGLRRMFSFLKTLPRLFISLISLILVCLYKFIFKIVPAFVSKQKVKISAKIELKREIKKELERQAEILKSQEALELDLDEDLDGDLDDEEFEETEEISADEKVLETVPPIDDEEMETSSNDEAESIKGKVKSKNKRGKR